MSFGISAAAWGAIGAGVGVVTAISAADSQRKAIHAQQDALNESIAADARQKAEAETSAALSANQKLVADKRARQANLLALGGNDDSTLGAPAGGAAPGSVLAQGATAAQRAVAASPVASVLGGGAPVGSSAGPRTAFRPQTVQRGVAL